MIGALHSDDDLLTPGGMLKILVNVSKLDSDTKHNPMNRLAWFVSVVCGALGMGGMKCQTHQ